MVSTTSSVLRMLTSMKVCTAEVQRGMLAHSEGKHVRKGGRTRYVPRSSIEMTPKQSSRELPKLAS